MLLSGAHTSTKAADVTKLKGPVKNRTSRYISFFSAHHCSISVTFCLLVEGKRQILVLCYLVLSHFMLLKY